MDKLSQTDHRTGFWVLVAVLVIISVIAYNYAQNDISPSSAAPIGPAVYLYVATDGDDATGDGSYANPFRTFREAVNHVDPAMINYLYPKGYLVLSDQEYQSGSDGPIVIPEGSDVRVTKSLVGPMSVQPTRIMGRDTGISNLIFEATNASLRIFDLEWDSVYLDVRAGENGSVAITSNLLFSTQAPGQTRLPGDLLVRTLAASADIRILGNTFRLADVAISGSIRGLEIMHSPAGTVSVVKNKFYYPDIDKRLSPDLDYEGIYLWRDLDYRGEGISILSNLFEHINTRVVQNEVIETDFGIILQGSDRAELADNNFQRFFGTPIVK